MCRRFERDGRLASAPVKYQRYFVPAIGGPVAQDLMAIADIHLGEHVLDVACGTGVVRRCVPVTFQRPEAVQLGVEKEKQPRKHSLISAR